MLVAVLAKMTILLPESVISLSKMSLHEPYSETAPLADGMRMPVRAWRKNAKKSAMVAVARTWSVPLHKSWVSGEVYKPLRNNPVGATAALSPPNLCRAIQSLTKACGWKDGDLGGPAQTEKNLNKKKQPS